MCYDNVFTGVVMTLTSLPRSTASHAQGDVLGERVPSHLLPLFRLYLFGELRRVITHCWRRALLFQGVCSLFALTTLLPAAGPEDCAAYGAVQAVIGALVLMGVVASRHPASAAHMPTWVPVLEGLIVAAVMVGVATHHSQALAVYCLAMGLIGLSIAVFCLNRTLGSASVVMAVGGLGVLAVPWARHPANVALYWGLYATACVAILTGLSITTYRIRSAFLLAVMLGAEQQEVRRLNRRLEDLVHEDALTGLQNRRAFDEHLHREWQRSCRTGASLSLLMIDVDHFKPYNDHHGHLLGDMCLRAIAACLSEATQRPGDVVARYGGEEFVVLLPETTAVGAAQVCERVHAILQAHAMPHPSSPRGGWVTVSIGMASVAGGVHTASWLLSAADEALYRAKAQGRACTCGMLETAAVHQRVHQHSEGTQGAQG